MPNEITIDALIEDAKLIIHDKTGLNEMIEAIGDCEIEIVFRKKVKRRSLNQNSYYWAVVIPAIQQGIKELGERLTLNETENWLIDFLSATDKSFTHEFLKHKFIESQTINESTGEIIKVKQSTRTLNKDNFSEYLERVIQFANETLEIEIPESTNN